MDEQPPIFTENNTLPPAEPLKQRNKMSPKRRRAILIVIIVVLAVGIIASLLLTNKTVQDAIANITGKTATSGPSTAAELVTEAKTKLAASSNAIDLINSQAPLYIPDGYDFYAPPVTSSGFQATTEQATRDANVTALKEYLIGLNYKQSGNKATGDDISVDESYLYRGDKIVCSMQIGTTEVIDETGEDTNKAYFTLLTCADISTYTATLDALKPFYDAYRASDKDTKDTPGFNVAQIKDSATSGYKIAQVAMSTSYTALAGGFTGLFYQTPDATWHYVDGGQDVLSCNDYSTTDSKKAFLGERCVNKNNTEDTVKL